MKLPTTCNHFAFDRILLPDGRNACKTCFAKATATLLESISDIIDRCDLTESEKIRLIKTEIDDL